MLRAAHAAIPVAWGLSTAVVLAGGAVVAAGGATRGLAKGDLVRLAGLLTYPVVPALALAGTTDGPARPGTRLAGAALSWPIEGLAFWPALISHVRRGQQAPAKTPR